MNNKKRIAIKLMQRNFVQNEKKKKNNKKQKTEQIHTMLLNFMASNAVRNHPKIIPF